MKQIKTIRTRFDDSEKFDERVNRALENGWRLTHREVLPAYETENYESARTLYAELERDDYVPASASCDTCAHSVDGKPSDHLLAICSHCDQCKYWEPRPKKGERL